MASTIVVDDIINEPSIGLFSQDVKAAFQRAKNDLDEILGHPIFEGSVVAEALTATTITALATAVVVQAANAGRKTLGIVNTGSGDAYFGWSSGVTAANGWPLAASGGGYTWGIGESPKLALYVYSTAGTTVIAKEGT